MLNNLFSREKSPSGSFKGTHRAQSSTATTEVAGFVCPDCMSPFPDTVSLLKHFEFVHEQQRSSKSPTNFASTPTPQVSPENRFVTACPIDVPVRQKSPFSDSPSVTSAEGFHSEQHGEINVTPGLAKAHHRVKELESALSLVLAEAEHPHEHISDTILRERVDAFLDRRTAWIKELSAQEAHVIQLKQKIEELEDSIQQQKLNAEEQYQCKLNDLTRKLDNVTLSLNEAQAERTNYLEARKVVEEENAKEVDQLSQQIADLQMSLACANNQLAALKRDNTGTNAMEHTDNVDDELVKLRLQLAHVSGQLQSTRSQLAEVQMAKEAGDNYQHELQFNLERTENKLLTASEKAASKDAQLLRLRHEVEEMKEQLGALKKEIESSFVTITAMLLSANNIQKKLKMESTNTMLLVDELQKGSDQLHAQLSEVKLAKSAVEAMTSELKSRFTAAENCRLVEVERRTTLEKEADLKQQQCQQLLQENEKLTCSLQGVQELNTQLLAEKQVFMEAAADAQQKEAISAEQLSQLRDQVATLDSHLQKINVSVDKVKSERDRLQSEILDIAKSSKEEADSLMEKIIGAEDTISQLQESLNARNEELLCLQSAMHELGRENQALQIAQERLTNRQWMRDEQVNQCNGCGKEFSLSVRKHHCRNCGKIFCQVCSSQRAPIAASKDPVRVCNGCFADLPTNPC